ncbi:hypothetical protein F5Y19DRAFT_471033 [Xylariaceae sp. FL1651]|nr:hypothetical protein F5Y19DRAFT_471033 [Xylariaceae sp. FL1651]
MAQGPPKKTSRPTASARANKTQPPKKGARVIKAKKGAGSSAADRLQRKMAAGIAAKTERLLGERAGHLELIGPGKKARGEAKDGKDAKAGKGGSRKFGQRGGSREDSPRGCVCHEMRVGMLAAVYFGCCGCLQGGTAV